MTLRQHVHEFYYGTSALMKLWQVAIYLLVFGAIIALLYEYRWIPNQLSDQFLTHLDLAIASVFSVDYLVRLYAAPKRWAFVRNIYNILDLIAILPSFLVFLHGAEILRAARLVRAIRALRVLRFIRLAKMIEIRTTPIPKKTVDAAAEVAYFETLMAFYNACRRGRKPVSLLRQTKVLFNKLNKEIIAANVVAPRSIFITAFYELLRQVLPAVEALKGNPSNPLEHKKIRAILLEMGDLLVSDAGMDPKKRLEERVTSRFAYLYLLLRGSVNQILVTASIAVCLNLFVRMMDWDHVLDPVLDYLSVMEGILGTLIALITSLNIRYSIRKRDMMDDHTMTVMNFLTYYSTRIRTLLDTFEPDDHTRRQVAVELKHHFDSIGASILYSTQGRTIQEIRFDTSAMQLLERIRFVIKPYKAQLDTRTYDKYEEMHGHAAQHINQLQLEATTELPMLFNELNHWLIRGVYFALLALSPLSAIPRLILMNLLQRAFYRIAQETDRAMLSHSLARLPIEQRVVRRLNRISGIFGY